MKIAFIGAGRMAEALISRLASQEISASDINQRRLNYLRRKYKVKIAKNNLQSFAFGKVVVLAVKPKDITEVLEEIRTRSVERRRRVIISIVAGISLRYLEKKLSGFPIVRAMPNNPCLVGKGITALARGRRVRSSEFGMAKEIFQAVGEVIEVPEKWMDAVTGLSGSGPAFVYRVIEALTKGGIASGLPVRVAEKLALQTVEGSAAVVGETGKSPTELVRMVASPGGTTIEGLKVIKSRGVVGALAAAVRAAAKKSSKLCLR